MIRFPPYISGIIAVIWIKRSDALAPIGTYRPLLTLRCGNQQAFWLGMNPRAVDGPNHCPFRTGVPP